MTKKELNDFRWIMKNIYEMEEQLRSMRSRSTSIKSQTISDEPKNTKQEDKMAKMIADIVDLENKISMQLDKAYCKMGKIEDAIARLPEREKYLIRLRYVRCKTWEEISIDIGYSWKQTHRIHASALKILKDDTK